MNICILGGNGFIGSHLAKRLKEEGHWIRIVDIQENQYMQIDEFCNENIIGDLRNPAIVSRALCGPNQFHDNEPENSFDEVYQMAADMGGAGYIFTGEHDADVMHNSAMINLLVAQECIRKGVKKLFYSSSACIYPAYNQEDPDNPNCKESSAYPAAPDSEYGWEKLFSERLYKAFERNYELEVRIARFHNIFGAKGSWNNGKEKSPAAICRKVAEIQYPYFHTFQNDELGSVVFVHNDAFEGNLSIDIWGDGKQTRSFLYIDECLEGIIRLMRSDCKEIVNIGSDEMISINDLAKMVIDISGKNLVINNINGPTGVRGRNSDNDLIEKELGWKPSQPLQKGIEKLYTWINEQVNAAVRK